MLKTLTLSAISLTPLLAVLSLGAAAPSASAAPQQDRGAPIDLGPAKDVKAQSAIEAVTLYSDRAAVTRAASVTLEQGVSAIRFGNLPRTVQRESIQARIGAGAKLVNVEYVETPLPDPSGSPEFKQLSQQIEKMQKDLGYLKQDRDQLGAALKLVDAVGVRATGDATKDGGTEKLNIEALKKELEFVTGERARLILKDREFADKIQAMEKELGVLDARRKAIGGGDRVERAAVITVASAAVKDAPVSLTYLVTNASWEPLYSIRSSADRNSVSMEFDATLAQNSGEDWSDVRLTLSTAQPTMNANPPIISPVFVTLAVPVVTGGSGGGGVAVSPSQGNQEMKWADANAPSHRAEVAKEAEDERLSALARMTAGAEVVASGTAVRYDLPRKVTVPTNSERQTRTLVATIDPSATWVYTAQPLLTDAVYLRAQLVNNSQYQLIPGPAQVFMGSEYIGPTRIGSVAPNGEFQAYFGIDRAIRAKRQVVTKTTGDRSWGRGPETVWEYRVTIDNGSGKDIKLELFDRRPVSQDEKVTAVVEDLSLPLSTATLYVRQFVPQGILRWDFTVPAGATGSKAMPVTWKVRLGWPKDVTLNPVPD